MNARQANSISIRNYLQSIGISPVRSNKRSSLYLAPYRTETNPSLKVSHDQNLWVDYGNDNKGGTLIDLILQIHPSYNVSDAIRAVENSTQSFFSFHQQQSHNHLKRELLDSKTKKRNSNHEIAITGTAKNGIANTEYLTRVTGTLNTYKLQELGNNPAINSYLKLRGIQIATAFPYCKEIYYTIGKKKYFGLASENNKGWSIRNKYWKGCTAQGYSLYKKGSEGLCVFEGIFDLLSFIELNKNNPIKVDFIVLNSLMNLKISIPIIEAYFLVKLFLDHDQAGRNATEVLLELLPNSRDASRFYSSYKDLNEYHISITDNQLLITSQ